MDLFSGSFGQLNNCKMLKVMFRNYNTSLRFANGLKVAKIFKNIAKLLNEKFAIDPKSLPKSKISLVGIVCGFIISVSYESGLQNSEKEILFST